MSINIDKNATSFASVFGLDLTGRVFEPVPGGSDTLKFSDAHGIISDCTASGGTENACDINNGSTIVVQGWLKLVGGEQCSLVVKGESVLAVSEYEPSEIIFGARHPNARCDLQVDGFSDQSRVPSFVHGRVRREDGTPVLVAFGRFKRPYLQGNYKILWGLTIELHAYNLLKDLARLLSGIKAGEKGPAWFP